jgi:hypothetical protein
MKYNFNYNIEKNGSVYGTSLTAAQYIADLLQNRVTSDKPVLEYRISTELESTGEIELLNIEREYLLNILISLPIDNYFKGKLVNPLVEAVVNGVPTEVKLWQLRTQLGIMGLETSVTNLINGLPETTDAEIEFKVKATNAWERAANVYRMSPTVTMLQQLLGLTDNQVDDIFKAAYLIEA